MSHEGERSTGKISGGWTHAETKVLKGFHFQAVCQRVLITWQRIATPLIHIESLLSDDLFEFALNSHRHEYEFNMH